MSTKGESILMHCVGGFEVVEHYLDNGFIYAPFNRLDFYLVDLKERKVDYALPSLLDWLGGFYLQKLFVLDSTVYLLGGSPTSEPIFDDLASDPTSYSKFYMGASRLDLKKAENVLESSISLNTPWVQMPPVHDRWYPLCTTINGHLYNFGRIKFHPEVFIPSIDRWLPLCNNVPEDIRGRDPSHPVVSDHHGNRILVHFPEAPGKLPCLYGFSPDGVDPCLGNWVCLSKNFPTWWSHVGPVVDGAIFLYCAGEQFIQPYDLQSGEQLLVQWSTPPLVDTTDIREDYYFVFDALLLLADGLLCLVGSSSELGGTVSFGPGQAISTRKILLKFLKFSAIRNDNMFVLTPVDAAFEVELPNTKKVCTLVPLC